MHADIKHLMFNCYSFRDIFYSWIQMFPTELEGTGISEVDDIILNTFGVVVGYMVFKAIIKRKAMG